MRGAKEAAARKATGIRLSIFGSTCMPLHVSDARNSEKYIQNMFPIAFYSFFYMICP